MRSRWFGFKQSVGRLGGIRIRLLGMILIVVVPLVAIEGFELNQNRQRIIEAAHARALDIARRGSQQYQRTIVDARALLETIALVPDVVAGSAATCGEFLEKAGHRVAWAADFWVIGTDGRILCTTVPGGVGADRSDREYFKHAMATRQFAVSDFFVGRLRGTPASMATLPVLDAGGAVTRVLAISLRLRWFSELFAELGAQDGARVSLFDGHGTLLARYPEKPEWVGNSWRGEELLARMEAVPEGSAQLPSRGGSQQIYGWAEVPGTRAHIAVGFERAQILTSVDSQTRKDLLALLAALVVAMLTSIPLARGVVQPLKLLTAGAEMVRNSPTASLPRVSGYAEVASLASSLEALLSDRGKREEALVAARAEAERAEQHARETHARLAAAIESLPQGIVIFDAEDRYLLWNRRYAEFYATGEELVQGELFEDRLRKSVSSGYHTVAVGREDEWLKERMDRHRLPESSSEQAVGGGRWLRVEERRMPDGGTIGVRVDITDMKRREESFRLLFNNNPLPMFVCDRETLRYIAVNDAAIAHYGYTREQFLSMTNLDIRPPEDREIVERLMRGDIPNLQRERIWPHIKADGTQILVKTYVTALTYEGRPAKMVAVIDLTDQKRIEYELRRTRTFLDTVVENIPAMLFVKDAEEQRYVLFNRAGEELMGVSRDRVIGQGDHDLLPRLEAQTFGARERKDPGDLQITEEEQIDTPHNGVRVLRTKKIAIAGDNGAPQYLLGIAEDITERKRAEAHITHMAHHDAMTGLANRALFCQRLEEALGAARAPDRGIAVLYLDLDGFKGINDTLGHPIGDALLCVVAERLKCCVRDGDTVARFGGDEFAVIQDGIDSPAEATALANRLVKLIGEPYQIEHKDVVIGVSIGVATAPGDSNDPDSLLKFADLALYTAKAEGGRTFRVFEPDMNIRMQARRALERDLHVAFADRQFELHYQPLVDLATNAVSGFEALLRWNHPERGLVSPAEFVPIAEEIGLIEPLGEWVLRQACADAADWPKNVRVAVNLSALQFRNRNLCQAVVLALAASGLAAHRLELEITESVLLQENDNNLEMLHELHSLGVRIALDDFGTGYSSLRYLRMFPFNKIKIDRSFVKELPENRECATIVRAIVQLAKGLRMATTAEGVETREQLEHMRIDGCTEAQGYFFSKPRPAAHVHEMLAQQRKTEYAA
jgi:diguanylate cyclase (GGDEF)-like protein/PAS domain S-box-containing protein